MSAELIAQVVNLLPDIQRPCDALYDSPSFLQLDVPFEEVATCLQGLHEVPRNVFGFSFKGVEFFAGLREDWKEAFECQLEILDLSTKRLVSSVWSAVPSLAASLGR